MFAPLIELDLFLDVHNVPPGPEPGIDAPRQRVCRMCATEVLLYGLKDWWIRERKKGFLDASVAERPDCPDGPTCRRQKEHGMFVLNIPLHGHDAQPTRFF
jgi:E3 ubiquitin-protein ligase CHFR